VAVSSDNRRSAAQADGTAIIVACLAISRRECLSQRPRPGFCIEPIKIGCAGLNSTDGRPASANEQIVLPLGNGDAELAAGVACDSLRELPIVSDMFVERGGAGIGVARHEVPLTGSRSVRRSWSCWRQRAWFPDSRSCPGGEYINR